jgi:hypothetical protein
MQTVDSVEWLGREARLNSFEAGIVRRAAVERVETVDAVKEGEMAAEEMVEVARVVEMAVATAVAAREAVEKLGAATAEWVEEGTREGGDLCRGSIYCHNRLSWSHCSI